MTARVQIGNVQAAPGATVAVPIDVTGDGTANWFYFSLHFDPAKLSEVDIAGTGLQIQSVNRDQAQQGRIGVTIAGAVPGAGQTVQAAKVMAKVVPGASGMATLGFGNQPTPMSAGSSGGGSFPVDFQSGSVAIAGTAVTPPVIVPPPVVLPPVEEPPQNPPPLVIPGVTPPVQTPPAVTPVGPPVTTTPPQTTVPPGADFEFPSEIFGIPISYVVMGAVGLGVFVLLKK